MSALKDAALALARDDGHKVFPCKPRGKTPATKRGHLDATDDLDRIAAWWDENPEYNIGLVAGDGLTVVDVDAGSGGLEWIREVQEDESRKIRTKMVRTGGGGAHLYFRDEGDPLPQSAGDIAPGVDVRSGGKGYVLAPPSVHPNGTPYKLANGSMAGTIPAWLREAAREGRHRERPTTPEGKIPEGERNAAMAALAGSLRRKGLGAEAILAALEVENEDRCEVPLDRGELEKIAGSVARYKAEDSYSDTIAPEDEFEADPDAAPPVRRPVVLPDGNVHLTDEWAVDAVLPALRGRVRYIVGSKRWAVWNGHVWTRDHGVRAELVIRDELKRIAMILNDRGIDAGKEGKALRAAARRFQSAAGIKAVTQLLQAKVAAQESEFDEEPLILNTPGGFYGLDTGQSHEPDPEMLVSRSTSVTPEEGPHPVWDAFLRTLTGGDEDTVRYLKRYLGYCLTGAMSEKTLQFIWGSDSDTGKSTFVKVVSSIMGTYHQSVDVSAFVSFGQNDRVPADIAQLPGVRLVTATEPSSGHSWDEKRIKAITGGDEVSARFLYGQWFTFSPMFKIMIVGNHEPEIRQVDDAMLRRIHIVPFNHKVPKDKQIPDLDQKIVEREGPAVLAWMMEGAREWLEHGIEVPELVRAKTSSYGEEEDILGEWIHTECETGPDKEETRKDLFDAWRRFCGERGEDPGKWKGFKRLLESRRDLDLFDAQVGDRRLRGFRGIALRDGISFEGDVR